MADGSFHSGRRSLECFRHLWVQYLRNGIDHIHIINSNDNGFSQILIALDVRRHTDLMDDIRNHSLDAGLIAPAQRQNGLFRGITHFLQPLYHGCCITGLQHQIPNAQVCSSGCHKFRDKSGCSQYRRSMLHRHQRLQYTDAVPFGQHHIQHQHLRPQFRQSTQRLLSIIRCTHHLKPLAFLQR